MVSIDLLLTGRGKGIYRCITLARAAAGSADGRCTVISRFLVGSRFYGPFLALVDNPIGPRRRALNGNHGALRKLRPNGDRREKPPKNPFGGPAPGRAVGAAP